jgi:hypothetical protein
VTASHVGRPGQLRSIPHRGGDNSVLYSVQIGSGNHSATYPIGAGDPFPGVKWPRREADHSRLVPRLRLLRAVLLFPVVSWRDA